MPTAKSIFELLPMVAKTVGAVGKGQNNNFDHYKFRGIDDVLAACHPALVEHGVSVLPEIVDHVVTEKTAQSGNPMSHVLSRIRHTFTAPDGSSVSCVTFGEGMDRGDKAANKAMAAAYKYALTLTLCLPVSLPDGDTESPEVERAAEHAQRKAEPSATPERVVRTPFEEFKALVEKKKLNREAVFAHLRDRRKKKLKAFDSDDWAWACLQFNDIAAELRGVTK